MKKLDYNTVMWAEMSPDMYDGENCDEMRPRFECFSEGDMSSEHLDSITLVASTFPPGTKITVELPCCPLCYQDVELCKTDEHCDFDWNAWCENEYF